MVTRWTADLNPLFDSESHYIICIVKMPHKASVLGLMNLNITRAVLYKCLSCKKSFFHVVMFVEDTYSSEEMVDQQPVLVKVMDTADQVMIYSMLFIHQRE